MFYVDWLLIGTAHLGTAWLAAHWEKKLNKQQIMNTDISAGVAEMIDETHVPLSLRLASHLLLGMARIFSKQVKYLLADCKDAMLKIKITYNQKEVRIDLQSNKQKVTSITLQEPQLHDVLPEIRLDEFVGQRNEPELNEVDILKRSTMPASSDLPPSSGDEMAVGWDDPLAFANLEEDPFGAFEHGHDDPLGHVTQHSPLEGEAHPLGPEDDEMFGFGGVGFMEEGEEGEGSREPRLDVPMEFDDDALDFVKPITVEQVLGVSINAEGATSSSESDRSVGPPRVRRKAPKVNRNISISTKVFKAQVNDSSALVRPLNLAPTNRKQAASVKRSGRAAADVLFGPLLEDLPQSLLSLFRKNMASNQPLEIIYEDEEEESPERMRDAQAEHPREDDTDFGFGGFEPEGFEPIDHQISISDMHHQEEDSVEPDFEPSAVGPVELAPRTKGVFEELKKKRDPETLQFSYMENVEGKGRLLAAGLFAELLNLRTHGFIDLEQQTPYGDIVALVN